jgi:hypothetical protein
VYGAAGRHVFVNVDVAAVNARFPFESTMAFVYGVPYSETVNGRLIGVVPSSTWLPVSVVPGVMVPAAVLVV